MKAGIDSFTVDPQLEKGVMENFDGSHVQPLNDHYFKGIT